MQEAMALKNPAGQINKNNAHVALEEQGPSMFCINYVVAGEMPTYSVWSLCYGSVVFP